MYIYVYIWLFRLSRAPPPDPPPPTLCQVEDSNDLRMAEATVDDVSLFFRRLCESAHEMGITAFELFKKVNL